MMRYLKWTFWIVLWGVFGAFLHYTLPQNDIARVVDTFERRIDFGENSIFWSSPDSGNAANPTNRDVLFIQTVRRNGRPMVYRNEDTGWGWPPYFKFDTNNLQTEAADLKSTKDNPQWVVVKHYGWRNEFISIFPNAVSIRAVDGPDVTIINWVNIIILTLIAAIFWAIWVRWRRFRESRIDPMMDNFGDAYDRVDARADETRGRISRWFSSWKSKPRR